MKSQRDQKLNMNMIIIPIWFLGIFLTLELWIEGAGCGTCYGGYCLGKGYVGADDDFFSGYGPGMESIIRIMDTVGVDRFNDLKGKYIRIAYKRLIKRYKTDSEEYIFALSFLVQLSLFHTEKSFDSTFNCLKEFYKNSYTHLKSKQENELQAAKDFTKASHFDKEEADNWISNVEYKNEINLREFIKQNQINFGLFDCKINEQYELEQDLEYIHAIIDKLYDKETFEIVPIKEIRIKNAFQKGIGCLFDSDVKNGKSYDYYTNGTYFDAQGTRYIPCGSIIAEDRNFECNYERVENRGGLAILNSGVIIIKQTNSNKLEDIKNRFAEKYEIEAKVEELPKTLDGPLICTT